MGGELDGHLRSVQSQDGYYISTRIRVQLTPSLLVRELTTYQVEIVVDFRWSLHLSQDSEHLLIEESLVLGQLHAHLSLQLHT